MAARRVGDQEQKDFSPLGKQLFFMSILRKQNYIVLTPNMAALSSDCKPRITNQNFQ